MSLKKKLLRRLDLRVFKLVWQSSRNWTIANFIFLTLQSLLPISYLYLLKCIFDTIEQISQTQANPQHLFLLIGLAGFVYFIEKLCQPITTLINEAQAEIVANYVYTILHKKSLELDLEFYEDSKYHDVFFRTRTEALSRPLSMVNGFAQLARSSISLFLIAVLLFTSHWILPVVLIFAIIPASIVHIRFTNEIYRFQIQQTQKRRIANYYHSIISNEQYVADERIFHFGQVLQQRFNDLRQQLYQGWLKINQKKILMESLSLIFVVLALFGSYSFIAWQTLGGAITIGSMVMYFQAFQRGQSLLDSMMRASVEIMKSSLFLSDFYKFVELQPKITSPAIPKELPQQMQQGFSVEGVSFRYPGSQRYSLRNINLTIPIDKITCIVGENGSGKTTLIKLLCRIYDPCEGRITLNGVDIREYDVLEYRSLVSVVFQNTPRYDFTIRENIWLGDSKIALEDPKVITTAENIYLAPLVEKLPQKYDTMLGKKFSGEELSQGEHQRILLARAFLRDSRIMILDEPSSAMDAEIEHQFFNTIQKKTQGKTTIFITHRLSTTKTADCIHALHQGEVVESGSHYELMQNNSKYASLFSTQAQYYID